jgi:hypothetical protein
VAGAVERCLACEAMVSKGNRVACPTPVNALCRDVSAFQTRRTKKDVRPFYRNRTYDGLATEAALHGFAFHFFKNLRLKAPRFSSRVTTFSEEL